MAGKSPVTLRSILLGFGLGVFVSSVTYFNDMIIRQTNLIGNHLPIVIFGFLVLLAFVVNPAFHKINSGWRLSASEIAVVIAIGLVSCGWPGAGFFYWFTGLSSMPGRMYQTHSAYQASNVISYVPGGSHLLAAGFVRNGEGLARDIAAGKDPGASAPARELWDGLSEKGRVLIEKAAQSGSLPEYERGQFVRALNEAIAVDTTFSYQACSSLALPGRAREYLPAFKRGTLSRHGVAVVNRAILETIFPGRLLPPPEGHGLVFENCDGNAEDVVALVNGYEDKNVVPSPAIVPWKKWIPVIIFWGGFALLLGGAGFCIVLIVQAQWMREMVPYPIATFLREATRQEQNRRLPDVAHNKLFWYGFGALLVIHLVNGLHAWFPDGVFAFIPLQFDFTALQVLHPELMKTPVGHTLMRPQFIPTVIAFTFFLNTEISFSAGISGFFYGMLYILVTGYGATWGIKPVNFSIDAMLRFGAFCGSALILFYLGRRYYVNVAASAFGRRRLAETPKQAMWAFRMLLVCIVGMVFLLSTNAVPWYFGILFVVLFLVFMTVLTRINAETGLFMIQPRWLPIEVLVIFFGIEAVGPVVFYTIMILSFLFAWSSYEMLMPFAANAVRMVTTSGRRLPRGKALSSLVTMIIVGFGVALIVTLYLQYWKGLNLTHTSNRWIPGTVLGHTNWRVVYLEAYDALSRSISMSGIERLMAIKPQWDLVAWAGFGFAAVIVCTLLRTRFAWWPIHPVLFLIWGTALPCRMLSASILMGWIVKVAATKMAGARGFHALKPLMIGIIAGEVFAAFGWICVGAVYYFMTGMVPVSYNVFL